VCEHATKRVVRGNVARQLQKLSKSNHPSLDEQLDVRPGVHSIEQRQNSDCRDVRQLMLPTAVLPIAGSRSSLLNATVWTETDPKPTTAKRAVKHIMPRLPPIAPAQHAAGCA
jgi:hypothetical protein